MNTYVHRRQSWGVGASWPPDLEWMGRGGCGSPRNIIIVYNEQEHETKTHSKVVIFQKIQMYTCILICLYRVCVCVCVWVCVCVCVCVCVLDTSVYICIFVWVRILYIISVEIIICCTFVCTFLCGFIKQIQAMFPLSWALVRAHTGRKMRAHKKTRSAQIFFLKKMLCTYTSMYKNTYRYGKITFCELHVFLLLLLMHLSRDFY